MELACGFQANVYLFAVYCNRAGLTLEAILCSVKNVHGTVPHLKKKKASERDDRGRKKKRGGVRGTHINPVQKKKKNHLFTRDSKRRGSEIPAQSNQATAK